MEIECNWPSIRAYAASGSEGAGLSSLAAKTAGTEPSKPSSGGHSFEFSWLRLAFVNDPA
jgi:hypothetical protein